ncbi:MAG: sigma 54-interacting transcriptional regulator, partial [Myxococcales bacterium]|nr:sigma 54-interacting transcriptional regulator [Myxococcales bacterium]
MTTSILPRPRVDVVDFHGIITAAPQMRDVFALIGKVARTDATALIRGESGTGKELVARAIHALSPRRDRPFHAINCATLTPELAASELFGHRKGSFTGAVRDRPGLFVAADGGTVFLDEIAELALDIQARLLRTLEERTVIPVGATDPLPVDVRLVSATHRSLRREVETRRFREDLMFRVRVVPLFLPPLRERDDDLDVLTWHFIDSFNQQGYRVIEGVAREAHEAIHGYAWPGNVRELRNAIEHAQVVGDGPVLTLDELPPELRGEPPPRASDEGHGGASNEHQRILSALRQAGGHKGKAAELLGI